MGSDHAQLIWEPPKADGGCPVTNYIIDKRDTSRAEWAQVTAKVDCKFSNFLVERLIEGREYQFRIRAENKCGTGEAILSNTTVAKNPFSKILFYITTLIYPKVFVLLQTLNVNLFINRCS